MIDSEPSVVDTASLSSATREGVSLKTGDPVLRERRGLVLRRNSRKSAFLGGVIGGYSFQALAMCAGIWLTPTYLRILGNFEYGLWLVGLQILTFLMLADFGVLAIVPRDVAQLSGREKIGGESGELLTYVRKTKIVVAWQTLALSALSALVVISRASGSAVIRGPVAFVLIAFCFSYPLRVYSAVLTGLQDLSFLSQIRMVTWFSSIAINVFLLFLGFRLYALAAGWSVNLVGYEAAAFWRLRCLRPDLFTRSKSVEPVRVSLKDWTRGLWLSVGQVSQVFLTGFDVLAIARLFGASPVVTYTCTQKLSTVLGNQPQLIASSALPGLSQMKTSESRERLFDTSVSLGQLMLIVAGAIACVVIAINEAFVTRWVGRSLFAGIAITVFSMVNLVLRQFDIYLAQALFALNRERPMAIKALVDSAVSCVACFVLLHWFGLRGAILGLLVGVSLVSLPVNLYLFHREFGLSFSAIVRPFIPFFLILIVACCAGYGISHLLHPDGYLEIALTALLSAGLYALMAIPYVLGTPLGRHLKWTANKVLERRRERVGSAR